MFLKGYWILRTIKKQIMQAAEWRSSLVFPCYLGGTVRRLWPGEDIGEEIRDWPQDKRTDDVSMESGTDALRAQRSSTCGKQTVNTICFTIDAEITEVVDFYCPALTTELLCIVAAYKSVCHIHTFILLVWEIDIFYSPLLLCSTVCLLSTQSIMIKCKIKPIRSKHRQTQPNEIGIVDQI